MTEDMMTLRALLEKSPDADLLREFVGRRDEIRPRFDTDDAHGLFPHAVE